MLEPSNDRGSYREYDGALVSNSTAAIEMGLPPHLGFLSSVRKSCERADLSGDGVALRCTWDGALLLDNSGSYGQIGNSLSLPPLAGIGMGKSVSEQSTSMSLPRTLLEIRSVSLVSVSDVLPCHSRPTAPYRTMGLCEA